MSNGTPLSLVATTVRSEDDARRLAATLLGRRLIACATMTPVVSMYRWQGMVESESEVQVVFKTTYDQVEDVVDAIEELHTYDLPEILKFAVKATEQYAAWVGEETSS